MRMVCSALLVAGAALLAGSSGTIAAPINGSVINAAADQLAVGESVHCRPFRHWHRWGYGRGCRGGATVIYRDGPSYRGGYGTRSRVGVGVSVRERSGTTYRSRESTTIRRGTREGTSIRGGATVPGTAGSVAPRGTTGGQVQGGGQVRGTAGGRPMATQPTAGQGKQGGQGAVPGTSGTPVAPQR